MTTPCVLIIEDEPNLAHIFSLVFTAAEYKVDIAADGETAMQILQSTQPDVVILDLHLPDISGQTILHNIRQDQRLMETQVVIVTADLILARSLPEGADIILIKPLDVNKLKQIALQLRPN